MLPILDLSQWPGSHPYRTRPLGGIVGVTLHYTAGSPSATPKSIAEYQISAAAADQTGADPRQPFPGIAYSLIVDGAGKVYLCWDLETRVWHSGAVVAEVSRNASHVGICYTGDVAPNTEQLQGLGQAIGWCRRQLGRALSLEGHRDPGYPTACPGSAWPAWRAALLGSAD